MIQLSKQHLRIIFNHAQSSYPEECCGVILGNISNSDKIAVEIIPTENAWNSEETVDNFQDNNRDRSKKRRYAIAPRKMLELQKSSREKELNIIGIFHSHPDYPAIPSEFDRKNAWQEYSYIIVSIQQGQPDNINSWVLDDNDQFQQEEIIFKEKEEGGEDEF
ncbi:MAG: M67 family metallopeptidase [Rivularia sp. ALOHA_DT_140]|nr:M67 family metallopeptidase [Rivularia sp. ALOHA_DT_140]